ncbi:unnamed protein product, partial [Rotaria sp. Silwood1]
LTTKITQDDIKEERDRSDSLKQQESEPIETIEKTNNDDDDDVDCCTLVSDCLFEFCFIDVAPDDSSVGPVDAADD